jgi:uroporphyrinogen-III synthase
LQSSGSVRLHGLVATPDGRDVVRVSGEGEPEELGARLAREALAAGAARILATVRGGNLVLSGRQIVVTRPREQAGPLAEGLERLGATVSIVPLVGIEPVEDMSRLDAALPALAAYDWIVFTSANGVVAVGERLTGTLAEAKVAAVGPATAEAVRALGVEPAFVPERFAAEEIAAGLEPVEGSRVLLPQADIAEPQLADKLRSCGATVDVIAAYRTIQIEPSASGISTIRRADAVILASGSAARSLARLDGVGDGALVVCIGPKTAEAARDAGLQVGLVADEATADGIIQALVEHFGQQSREQRA